MLTSLGIEHLLYLHELVERGSVDAEEGLELGHVKRLAARQCVKLASLALPFGANRAGKSTTLQALRVKPSDLAKGRAL
jgi:hypothetical protein